MTTEEMNQRKRELGYTYKRISELSGLPLGTVQKVLGGITKSPRYDTLKALEKVFEEPEIKYDPEADGADCLNEGAAPYMAGSPAEKINVKKQGEYTLDDYYALPDDRRVELIDGVIYDMAAPAVIHQIIAGHIYAAFLEYVRKNKGRCIPMISPLDVRLDMDNKTMVEPDVLILCDKSRVKRGIVYGAPDFVLEILSPSTRRKDMVLKLNKYCFAGVKEYWIVDPKNENIMVYKFEDEIECRIYERKTPVPVGIWNDECLIDFDEIFSYIEEIGIQE